MNASAADINRFWRWFRLAGLERLADGAEIADRIYPHLIRLDDRLGLEVSDVDNGLREIIFTANGHRDLFPLVRLFVQKAPELGTWKLTALKPAQGFDFHFSKAGINISPADWMFIPLKGTNGTLGVRILIPGQRGPSIQVLKNILQTGIGEERLAVVAHIEYCHQFGDIAENRWTSIRVLSTYIDLGRARQVFSEPDPCGEVE